MEQNRQNSILNFLASCNEFLSGKFLFASAKLISMYEELVQSPPLKELFEQCSQDFDYSLQCTISLVKTPTKPGYFERPEQLDKFLALVFGILKDIYEEKIDFNIFVSKYFSADEKLRPTQKFAAEMILPLRDTVAKYFELDENNTARFVLGAFEEEKQSEIEPQKVEEEEKEEEFDLTPVFENLKKVALNMMALAKEDKKMKTELKTDLLFVLSELLSACKTGDIEKAYALVVALKYITKKQRNLAHLMAELLFVVAALENL